MIGRLVDTYTNDKVVDLAPNTDDANDAREYCQHAQRCTKDILNDNHTAESKYLHIHTRIRAFVHKALEQEYHTIHMMFDCESVSEID